MRTIIKEKNTKENTSFGAIHLKVSSLEKATLFWTKIAGLKVRKSSANSIEFGSENNTLVVVHNSAQKSYVKGYSGLYHFAIHVPNEAELASVINRLTQRGYPHSPTDHKMSKAVYLEDLEGITVEFTLETPEREIVGDGSMGRPKPLDVREIMQSLENDDIDKIIDDRCFIGHVHLYANNVENSNEFYKKIGFTQNKYMPQMVFADLGAGGDFGHRIALNSWHGNNRPLAPNDIAGLEHFQLTYRDKDQLEQIVKDLGDYEKTHDGYWVKDPTGNKIFLN
jgi:catechol 2,3-dioxygenase